MSYVKQTWANGDVITADKLNHLEDGIASENAVLESFIGRTITSVSSDALTSIGDSAFYGCSALTTLDLPVATSIGDSAFGFCSALATLDLPVATSIGGYAFSGCSALTTVDLPVATSIGESAFGDCTALTTVILRKNQVVTLSGTNVFTSADNAIIYVPDDLVASYKADANWSSLASRIKGISELPSV